jgi:hypothetical protein
MSQHNYGHGEERTEDAAKRAVEHLLAVIDRFRS